MNTGPIRYESYMPGPGDEPENGNYTLSLRNVFVLIIIL